MTCCDVQCHAPCVIVSEPSIPGKGATADLGTGQSGAGYEASGQWEASTRGHVSHILMASEPFTPLQNTRRFTQFHPSPREADSGEIIEPSLMIFVIFHEAFMRAILKDSSNKRNSLLGKKLVKCTIITQHHLQRDRILWKCTWEASINNLIPTFTCLESGKVSFLLSNVSHRNKCGIKFPMDV